MKFSELVYDAVKKIPRGGVSTYSEIAKSIGKPNSSRAVGQVLRRNPHKEVPCHRVIKSSGEVGGFKGSNDNPEKAAILRKEGIEIEKNMIDLERFLAPHA
jgi:O-6-methylguanine DNA methyltransferase